MFTGWIPMPTGELPRLAFGDGMESSAQSHELRAYVESDEASGGSEAGVSSRLGALLMLLLPFSLAAWFAIGLAVYRAVI
jgi:hypothetical protein